MTRLEQIRELREILRHWQSFVARLSKTLGVLGIDTNIEEAVKGQKDEIRRLRRYIRKIKALNLDPKEKDGCQTVGARVVRLCDEALGGK